MDKKANNQFWIVGIVAVVAVAAIALVSSGDMSGSDDNLAGKGSGDFDRDDLKPMDEPIEPPDVQRRDNKEQCPGSCIYEFDNSEVIKKPCYRVDECICNRTLYDAFDHKFNLVGSSGNCKMPQNRECGMCKYEEASLDQPCYNKDNCTCPTEGRNLIGTTERCKPRVETNECSGQCTYHEGEIFQKTINCNVPAGSEKCSCPQYLTMTVQNETASVFLHGPNQGCEYRVNQGECAGYCEYEIPGTAGANSNSITRKIPCQQAKNCTCPKAHDFDHFGVKGEFIDSEGCLSPEDEACDSGVCRYGVVDNKEIITSCTVDSGSGVSVNTCECPANILGRNLTVNTCDDII